MDKRSILAIVLSLAVLYIYQVFFVKPPLQKPPAANQHTETVTDKPKDKAPPPAPVARDGQVSPAGVVSLQQPKGLAEKEIPIETDEYYAIFTTRGAALKSLKLKKYHKTIDKNSDLIELVNVKPTIPAPLSLSFSGSDFSLPEDAVYEVKVATPASKTPAAPENRPPSPNLL